MHGLHDVLFGRLASGVLLVVRQDHHILAFVTESLVQESRHVLDIVDAPSQLPPLAKVINTNQQGLAFPGASAEFISNLRIPGHLK